MLDEIQERIVEAPDKKILVIAGSGSGKTAVLTERIKYLITNGVDPRDVVAITFTNAAADEMKERLGSIVQGAYIGTIHGYANYLLNSYGVDTSNYLKDENFDELFDLILTYPQAIKKVEHLLVDEFQDVDDNQYNFLIEMINAKNLFIIGDDYQNIYSFRGARLRYFLNLYYSPDFTIYELYNNYRSGYNIITFASRFIEKVGSKIDKKVVCKNPNPGLVITFEEKNLYGILDEINKSKQYDKWFILTRTNAQVDEAINFLIKNHIPCDTFKKSDLTNAELKNKMKHKSVKVLTVHTAKGLENDNVAIIGIIPYNDDERRLAYVAATRAKNLLIWCYNKKRKRKTSF